MAGGMSVADTLLVGALFVGTLLADALLVGTSLVDTLSDTILVREPKVSCAHLVLFLLPLLK